MEKDTVITTALGIFLKYPTPGRAKTRLAATIGNERAADVYRKLLDAVIAKIPEFEALKIRVFLYVDPANTLAEYQEILPRRSQPLRIQKGKDLGARMQNAMNEMLEEHESAFIIGSDCIDINDDHVKEAQQLVNLHDIVLGPTLDGGYYLVGMNKMHAELFEMIPWSTDVVFEKTCDRAKKMNLTVGVLPKLRDIDTEEDLKFI